ncbi:MAG: HEAT repeat domain-containing protein [Caldilineaceae bacterium]
MINTKKVKATKELITDLVEEFESEFNDYYATLAKLCDLDKESTLQILQEFLTSPDSKFRYYASDILLELDTKMSQEFVLPLLKDVDEYIRHNLCTKLCYYGDYQAVNALIDVLNNDQSNDVRLMAAVALGRIGDKRAIPHLLNTIAHDSGYDSQGEPVSSAAKRAVDNITNRSHSKK